jgi:hypothetical protein
LEKGKYKMTAQSRLAELLEIVATPTNRQIIVADIIAAVGLDGSRLVLGTLQAASAQDPVLAAAYQALVTVGISLSGDDRQAMLDTLAAVGSWPDSVRDAVKALGVLRRPRWQMEGYTSEPTMQQIQTEILRTDLRAQFDSIINQVGTDEQDDAIVALRSIADDLES